MPALGAAHEFAFSSFAIPYCSVRPERYGLGNEGAIFSMLALGRSLAFSEESPSRCFVSWLVGAK